MTNKEYIQVYLSKFGITDQEIELMLLNAGLNGGDPVTDTKALDTAIYYQLPPLFAGMQDVSEGGYSIKWNLDGIKLWYSWLARKLGLPDNLVPKPTVKGISPW
ncbi:DUF6706 family protein [Chitinophaga niabensis]|uniref:DUF6706 family protein n=1 Tax=Chitinophaga niabensis TaxID=536979 RepID=UPI0031BA7EFA